MTLSLFLLGLGIILGGMATAMLAASLYRRQQRQWLESVRTLVTQQASLHANKAVAPLVKNAQKLTEIVGQLQEGQGKSQEQLHKLAEFSLQMKKEVAVLSARQLLDADEDAEAAHANAERPRYLN